jgi:hypothetical protein
MKIRLIEIVRAGWGAALLLAPRQVLLRFHARIDRRAIVVARILGARHVAQAVLSGANPSPEVLATGVWVDTMHCLTALGLAGVDRYRVRAAVVDTVIAALWAAFGMWDLRSGSPWRPPKPHAGATPPGSRSA